MTHSDTFDPLRLTTHFRTCSIILNKDPDGFALSAGTHRDWPDSRGLYCNTWEGLPTIALWVNFEDHVSVGTITFFQLCALLLVHCHFVCVVCLVDV